MAPCASSRSSWLSWSSRPVVTNGAGEVMVGCGGAVGWPASVMAGGLQDALTSQGVVAAFRELLADPQAGQELRLSFLRNGADDTEWRVLATSGDTYTLELGSWTEAGPGDDAWVFDMVREGRTWRWLGGGQCPLLGPVLTEGNTRVVLEAPSGGLDRESLTPTVALHELACTGARDPAPYLHEPVVVESADAVVVYWTSTPLEGAATCPFNPSVTLSLTLIEPLGDRPLLDGLAYPPRPVVPANDVTTRQ